MTRNQVKNKLIVEASEEAFEYLRYLFSSGQLNQILKVSVVNLSFAINKRVFKMSETALVTVVQQFGWDSTYAADKILIQLRNGAQYFVWYDWYDNPIIPKVGSVITLTYEGSDSSCYLYKLINTGTGKETCVLQFARANQVVKNENKMTSHNSYWKELTDKDEITEILEVINKQPLEFASTEEVQTHGKIAEQFIESILGCGWVFISDESSLYDFDFIDEVTNLEKKIDDIFGVDVSDIEDKNLMKIFERIDGSV